MTRAASGWAAQKRGWKQLKSLHPVAIDLDRLSFIRECTLQNLSNSREVESLLLKLGLNDEAMNEFPSYLHQYCGQGVRLWQYPNQFCKYLVHLSKLQIKTYLEIGVRHGGSFVVTVEYLKRFADLDRCVGVDIIPSPSMIDYEKINPQALFYCCNTQSEHFADFVEKAGPFDLVFIDSHHDEAQRRRDYLSIKDHAKIIGFHDITNVGCPDVAKVWLEIKRDANYSCFEYVDQYESIGPFMGIGLAIEKSR
jgi:hypothetical protein